MKTADYLKIKQSVIDAGYLREIEWVQHKKPCDKSVEFLCEYIYVILNSGMKNQVAEGIYQNVLGAIRKGQSVGSVFRHPGKVAAIEKMQVQHAMIFREYQKAEDKIAFLEALPWIGPITKFHLARNRSTTPRRPSSAMLCLS